MRLKEQLYEALEYPRKIKPYIWGRTIGRLQNIPYRLAYEKQYKKLHRDLFKEDKYLVIVLDACRHDYLEQEYSNYLEGEFTKAYSSGRNTFQYMRNTYPDDHKEMLYVSGATPINSVVEVEDGHPLYKNYTPKEHLRILDVDYSDELGTVAPEDVTRAALNNLEEEEKMVAHYFQPHGPYIGEYRIEDEKGKPMGEHVQWDMFMKGEITEREMRKAYRSNLKAALKEAAKLVEKTEDDRRIVITADHGELFGKHGITAHSEQHPGLRLVPWLEVEDISEEAKPDISDIY